MFIFTPKRPFLPFYLFSAMSGYPASKRISGSRPEHLFRSSYAGRHGARRPDSPVFVHPRPPYPRRNPGRKRPSEFPAALEIWAGTPDTAHSNFRYKLQVMANNHNSDDNYLYNSYFNNNESQRRRILIIMQQRSKLGVQKIG